MKVAELLNLAGARRYKILYSKDLPHYRLLQATRVATLIGLLSFTLGIFMSGALKGAFFILAAFLILFAALADKIVTINRASKHDSRDKDRDLFDLNNAKGKR